MKAYLERFRAWWGGLADRERRVLAAGGAVLAVVLAYLLVWEPVTRARQTRETALAAARALAVTLETLAAEAQRGRAGGAVTGAGQSLLSVVDQTRKAVISKPPSRLVPEGDGTVRIWLEDVPFDAVVRWLNDLQTRYGVRVDAAEIERESASGLVSARLTLMR